MTIHDFRKAKQTGRKIAMITCYDFPMAQALADGPADCLLVGDTLAMVVHGHDSTLPATPSLMALHTRAVRRGAPTAFLITDLPFLAHRRGVRAAMDCVAQLARAGADAVKLEGVDGHERVIQRIVGSGIPVMGHLGLTPQSVRAIGGFHVQGRNPAAAEAILDQARRLEDLGCFALVLECIPAELAERVTGALAIPTIGIGAGPACDGQVLVLPDLLGLTPGFEPRFLRRYLAGAELVRSAVGQYAEDVRGGRFPAAEESY